MKIRRIDHIGIVVQDLPAAIDFFLQFGLEIMGEQPVQGELADRIIGLPDAKMDIAMLRTPDGEANIELIQFQNPSDDKGLQPSFSNTLGLRHIAFAVEDIDFLVAKLKKNGTELVGEIVNYQNVYKVCLIRGPEGIILELAEEL